MIFLFIFKHFCNLPNVLIIRRKNIPSKIFNLLLFSSHFTPFEVCLIALSHNYIIILSYYVNKMYMTLCSRPECIFAETMER